MRTLSLIILILAVAGCSPLRYESNKEFIIDGKGIRYGLFYIEDGKVIRKADRTLIIKNQKKDEK